MTPATLALNVCLDAAQTTCVRTLWSATFNAIGIETAKTQGAVHSYTALKIMCVMEIKLWGMFVILITSVFHRLVKTLFVLLRNIPTKHRCIGLLLE